MNPPKKVPNILVVDDEPKNIQVLGKILMTENYQISFAQNGQQTLDIVTNKSPDIILLDIMMPEMSGFEVIRRLKANDDTKDTPVIFITAKAEVENEVEGLTLGAVDYITKPIIPKIVLARVKTHLELKAAREKLEVQTRELNKNREQLERQNQELIKAAKLREDVDRISRHDLKGPLNAIVGIPQLLLTADNLLPSQIDDLRLIEDAGYRMLDLINFSLNLFKMEQENYTFKPTSVELIAIINKIFFENNRSLKNKQLRTRIMIDGVDVDKQSRFWVWAEKLLCYSMFSNLIKNAIEASPSQSLITVNCEEDTYTMISIKNRGEVPPDIKKCFFDKYVTNGKSGGTGLGTYSARLIAKAQEGDIWMNSKTNDDTTITVQLLKDTFRKTGRKLTDNSESTTIEKESKTVPENIDSFLIRDGIEQSQRKIILALMFELREALSKMEPVQARNILDELSLFLSPSVLSQLTRMLKGYDYDEALQYVMEIMNRL